MDYCECGMILPMDIKNHIQSLYHNSDSNFRIYGKKNYICVCNSRLIFTENSIKKHYKSKRHMDNMKKLDK
jgi:hypothetical protein